MQPVRLLRLPAARGRQGGREQCRRRAGAAEKEVTVPRVAGRACDLTHRDQRKLAPCSSCHVEDKSLSENAGLSDRRRHRRFCRQSHRKGSRPVTPMEMRRVRHALYLRSSVAKPGRRLPVLWGGLLEGQLAEGAPAASSSRVQYCHFLASSRAQTGFLGDMLPSGCLNTRPSSRNSDPAAVPI